MKRARLPGLLAGALTLLSLGTLFLPSDPAWSAPRGKSSAKPLPAKMLISGHIMGTQACPGDDPQKSCNFAHIHTKNENPLAIESMTGTYELTGGTATAGDLSEPRTGPLTLLGDGKLQPGAWGFASLPVWHPPSNDARVDAKIRLEVVFTDGKRGVALAECTFVTNLCDRSATCKLIEELPPEPPPRKK